MLWAGCWTWWYPEAHPNLQLWNKGQKGLIFFICKHLELLRHAGHSSNTAYISIIFNTCCDTPWIIHASKKLEWHRLLSICLHVSLLFKTKLCNSWFYINSWFFFFDYKGKGLICIAERDIRIKLIICNV